MALTKFREPNQVKWFGSRPGHNGEQVIESGRASNATVILYTVPAGKTFYWCGWNFVYWAVAFSSNAELRIYDGVPAIWRLIQEFACGGSQAMVACRDYWPPIEIPATYSIRIQSTVAAHILQGTINGWVE